MHSRRPMVQLLPLCMSLLVGMVSEAPAQASNPKRWTPFLGLDYAVVSASDGQGSVGGSAGVFIRAARLVELGLDAGLHGLGASATVIPDFDGQPGAVYREDYHRRLWHLTGQLRVGAASGAVRPYAAAGVGVYGLRVDDRIVVTDPGGNRVPFYDFHQVWTDTKPGLTAAAGVELPRLVGRLALDLSVRWHGVLGGLPVELRTADYVMVGVGARLHP